MKSVYFLSQRFFSILCFAVAFFIVSVGSVSAATYYVDATGGNDSNSGTSTDQAWQTLNKVNTSSFSPGDSILFKRGELWREKLTAPSSGSSGSPITFGAYGSGENPIFDGSEIVTEEWTQYAETDYVNGFSGNPNTQLSDGASRNYRNIIPANSSSVDGTRVRVSIRAATVGGGGTIEAATIAPMTTGAVFDSTPVVITWDGGSSSVTVAQGQTKVSDEITFDFDRNQRYGIHFWSTDRDFVLNTSANGMYGMANGSTSEANTLNPSGTGIQGGPFALTLLEVYADAPEGVWYQALEDDPFLVWEDDTVLVPQESIAGVVAELNTSLYTDGNLYIHTSDESDPNANGRIYEVAARTETFDDNGKGWIILDGIDHRKTGGDVTTLGGIKNTGSNNIFRNLKSYDHYRHSFCFYGGAQNNLVTSIEAYNSHSTTPICIYEYDSFVTTNNTLRNSVLHNESSADGGAVVVNHGGASGNTISDNQIYGAGPGSLNGIIHVFDAGSSLRILRNKIYGAAIGGGIALQTNSSGSEVSYNVIDASDLANTFSFYTAITTSSSPNNKIYNNTIYGSNGNAAIRLGTNSTGAQVKNNIVYGATTFAVVESNSTSGTVFDNNLVYNLLGNFGSWSGSTYTNFTDWKMGSSQDVHSLNVDPQFTNYGAEDLSLSASSPAIDAAEDLGTSFNTGLRAGTVWPSSVLTANQSESGLAWDIGAFIFRESVNPSVSVTSPAGGEKVTGVATFTADASDASAVASVQFYLNGSPIGSLLASPPYELSWDSTEAADGQYTLTAVATDTYGNTTTSTEVSISVQNGQASSSSSHGSRSSRPKPPSCDKERPVGQVDLFQIDRSGDAAKLYFTPVQDHVGGYNVIFGYQEGDERFGGISMPYMNENQGVQSMEIHDLDPKVPYFFKVIPTNGCAPGEWSNWLKVDRVTGRDSIFYRYMPEIVRRVIF